MGNDQQRQRAAGRGMPEASAAIAYGLALLGKRQRDIQSGLETMGVSFDRACWMFHFDAEPDSAATPPGDREPAR